MGNIKASPQSINLLLVSLLLIPRFFSEALYQTGTVLILIFWISPFVLISEMGSEDWNIKSKLSGLPKSTSSIFAICLILIFASIYWRKIIYADEINSYQNLKRSLYLLNPLILISWYPFIKTDSKRNFLIYFLVLTFGLFACLAIPKIFEVFYIGDFLNTLTASISGLILRIFVDPSVKVDANYIYASTSSIRVGAGCSSTPQILISLFASLSLYICCKIRSRKIIFFYIITAIILVFTFNSIRISILGYLISIEKFNTFDFWHDGAGSLIFSFLIMLVTCSIYYYLWAKENSIEE